MAQRKQTIQPWGGNLPCCHGPKDGCVAHNSARTPTFWDSSLPSSVKPVTDSFLETIFGDRSKNKPSQGQGRAPEPEPVILSVLPRESANLDNLPLVHPSVPYTISFYHIHAAMSAVADGEDPSALLNLLTCRGTSGSRPKIAWSVTPLVANGTFLLEHAYEFPINLQHEAGDTSYHTKNWFVSKGFRSFAPCSHCVYVFRSIRETRKDRGDRHVCVEFSLRNVLGQEFRDEWSSEAGRRQPQKMCCGMCYTDFCLSFQPQWRAVQVRLWSHRDLGAGVDPSDPKWIAAMGGQAIQRDKKDFGRIRSAFRSPAELGQQETQNDMNWQSPAMSSQQGSQMGSYALQDASNAPSPPPYSPKDIY